MVATRPVQGSWTPRATAGFAWLGAAAAWTVAGLVGAVLAVVITAILVVAGIVGALVVAVTGFVPRAKADDPDLIEAHNVGGHSWVAYGWRGQP